MRWEFLCVQFPNALNVDFMVVSPQKTSADDSDARAAPPILPCPWSITSGYERLYRRRLSVHGQKSWRVLPRVEKHAKGPSANAGGPSKSRAHNGAADTCSGEPEATASGSFAARFSLRSVLARICHEVSFSVVGFLPLLTSRSYLLLTSDPVMTTWSPRRSLTAASFKRLKQTTRCQSVRDSHSPCAFFQERRVATDSTENVAPVARVSRCSGSRPKLPMIWIELCILLLLFLPRFLEAPKSEGFCSQSERLHSWRVPRVLMEEPRKQKQRSFS